MDPVTMALLLALGGVLGYHELKQEMMDQNMARANQNKINQYAADANGCWWRIGTDGVTRYICPEDIQELERR